MSATASLTSALQKQVLLLEDDLRARVEGDLATRGRWVMEHDRATTRGRTASSWQAWRDDRVTQAAVAWVLATVFVRFCEDNALVARVWIAGPEHRRQEALDAQLAFFRTHPEDTDREWLLEAVGHLLSLPATAALVEEHSPLWQVSPSGDAATALMSFWRQRGDDGALVHDLNDLTLDTRFLGDLYQDLSEHAKATYALLQTPVFVEEFILDRTLDPALAERPLEGFRMIDPTCGSGHFLLGAFARLLDRWDREAPGLEVQARVQSALDAINGVDLNPFAVAIARFRLTVAALKACGLPSLADAPAFRFHLAVGDSLLHGPGQQTLHGDADLAGFAYLTEDLAALDKILAGGRYDAVVGNPPYITVSDKVLNQAYRDRYASCKGPYALAVPFMERFFSLAKTGFGGQLSGWVGQITSNSFMKREFGSKLIEEFLPGRDLRLVIDSEGAWIAGHNSDGTPTVILIGRNQRPIAGTVRAVLSKGRRETRAEGNEGRGPYWSALVEHLDEPGWDNEYLTIADVDREILSHHPWSLSGGESANLKSRIESASPSLLSSRARRIGFMAMSHAEEAFPLPEGTVSRKHLEGERWWPLVGGPGTRDYVARSESLGWWPYEAGQLRAIVRTSHSYRWLWPQRTSLGGRAVFGGGTYQSTGRPWYEWHQRQLDAGSLELSIAFAEIATHNHFVLDRGGRIFKQTAPVIKLPPEAGEKEYLGLLGILNSSSACFWLKQRCKPKGGAADQFWARTFQFNSSNLLDFPMPSSLPTQRARLLDDLAQRLSATTLEQSFAEQTPDVSAVESVRREQEAIRTRMIAVQEELDWEVYRQYGLTEDDLTYVGDDLPDVSLGERAFEVVLAGRIKAGDASSAWFSGHGSKPIESLPTRWPADYQELVRRRMALLVSDPAVGLLESPEYKRRWESEPWAEYQERALRAWLQDRLERPAYWFDGQGRPNPKSVAQLADEVGRDADLVNVLKVWEGRPDVPVTDSLVRLLADESVPYLAAHRHTDSGLRKREAWEETWALQRREDAGESVGTTPVPPTFASTDFSKASYWQARGKLDVPKERFVLYPEASRETDPTPLIGWAGWDHAQQSLALSVIIGAREADGWDDERLVALVAGLAELQPWVEQWHSEVDPAFGVSLASFCREQLTARASQVGMTLEELAAWRPEPTSKSRKPREAS